MSASPCATMACARAHGYSSKRTVSLLRRATMRTMSGPMPVNSPSARRSNTRSKWAPTTSSSRAPALAEARPMASAASMDTPEATFATLCIDSPDALIIPKSMD
ncbi:hypothetical protein D3C86_1885900 [compost metagenome]